MFFKSILLLLVSRITNVLTNDLFCKLFSLSVANHVQISSPSIALFIVLLKLLIAVLYYLHSMPADIRTLLSNQLRHPTANLDPEHAACQLLLQSLL